MILIAGGSQAGWGPWVFPHTAGSKFFLHELTNLWVLLRSETLIPLWYL